MLNGVDMALSNCGKWRQIPATAGSKLRQVCCRLLSHFVSTARLCQPGLYDRKGLVSCCKSGFQGVQFNAVSCLV